MQNLLIIQIKKNHSWNFEIYSWTTGKSQVKTNIGLPRVTSTSNLSEAQTLCPYTLQGWLYPARVHLVVRSCEILPIQKLSLALQWWLPRVGSSLLLLCFTSAPNSKATHSVAQRDIPKHAAQRITNCHWQNRRRRGMDCLYPGYSLQYWHFKQFLPIKVILEI